jgi:hypothetical protein
MKYSLQSTARAVQYLIVQSVVTSRSRTGPHYHRGPHAAVAPALLTNYLLPSRDICKSTSLCICYLYFLSLNVISILLPVMYHWIKNKSFCYYYYILGKLGIYWCICTFQLSMRNVALCTMI